MYLLLLCHKGLQLPRADTIHLLMDETNLVKNLVNVLGTFYIVILLTMLYYYLFYFFFRSLLTARTIYIIIYRQMQLPRSVFSKKQSENMQQIYWRISMPKCEITLRHGRSPVNFLRIFRTPFSKNTSGWVLAYRTLNIIERCYNSLYFTKNLCKIDKYIQNIP